MQAAPQPAPAPDASRPEAAPFRNDDGSGGGGRGNSGPPPYAVLAGGPASRLEAVPQFYVCSTICMTIRHASLHRLCSQCCTGLTSESAWLRSAPQITLRCRDRAAIIVGAGLCISIIVCLCVRRLAVITHSRRLAQASGTEFVLDVSHCRPDLRRHDLLRGDLLLW